MPLRNWWRNAGGGTRALRTPSQRTCARHVRGRSGASRSRWPSRRPAAERGRRTCANCTPPPNLRLNTLRCGERCSQPPHPLSLHARPKPTAVSRHEGLQPPPNRSSQPPKSPKCGCECPGNVGGDYRSMPQSQNTDHGFSIATSPKSKRQGLHQRPPNEGFGPRGWTGISLLATLPDIYKGRLTNATGGRAPGPPLRSRPPPERVVILPLTRRNNFITCSIIVPHLTCHNFILSTFQRQGSGFSSHFVCLFLDRWPSQIQNVSLKFNHGGLGR